MRRACVVGVVGALLVGGIGLAAPASAAGSGFAGTIQSPARGDSVATIRGDVTIDPSDCPLEIGDYERSADRPVYVGLFTSAGDFLSIMYSTDRAETTYLDERWPLEPGNYELKLAARYDRRFAWDSGRVLPCVSLSPTTISVVEEVSTARETVASPSRLYVGEFVELGLEFVVAWSDGVSTRRPAPNDKYRYKLQQRALGTSDWETRQINGPNVKVVADQAREFRILDGALVSKSVVVDVIRPTSAREVSAVTVTPTAAIAGATLTLTGSITSQFTDQTWRPSPVGTSFEVQFLPEGGDSWMRLYESSVQDEGVVSAQFPMTGSGRYRVASSGAVSASVEVVAIVPTSVVAVEPLALPTAISSGGPLNISSTASVEYSDGVYRPVTPGTSYVVEFRPMTTSRAQAPKWRVIRTVAVVKAGVIKTRVTARASGHWRVRLGKVATPPVFVRVR